MGSGDLSVNSSFSPETGAPGAGASVLPLLHLDPAGNCMLQYGGCFLNVKITEKLFSNKNVAPEIDGSRKIRKKPLRYGFNVRQMHLMRTLITALKHNEVRTERLMNTVELYAVLKNYI